MHYKKKFNLLANWVAYITQLNDYWPLKRSTRLWGNPVESIFMRLVPKNTEIGNIKMQNSALASMIKKKKKHILRKKKH